MYLKLKIYLSAPHLFTVLILQWVHMFFIVLVCANTKALCALLRPVDVLHCIALLWPVDVQCSCVQCTCVQKAKSRPVDVQWGVLSGCFLLL